MKDYRAGHLVQSYPGPYDNEARKMHSVSRMNLLTEFDSGMDKVQRW